MHKYRIFSALVLAVLIVDQLTKLLVTHSFSLWDSLEIIPGFFNLVFVANRGAAFGFLNRADIQWQIAFFTVVACIAMVAIGFMLHRTREKEKMQIVSLALIFGGAAGNLIDRVRLGYVIDFLDFYYGSYHWPAFNVADSAICIGAGLMLLEAWKKESNASDTY